MIGSRFALAHRVRVVYCKMRGVYYIRLQHWEISCKIETYPVHAHRTGAI